MLIRSLEFFNDGKAVIDTASCGTARPTPFCRERRTMVGTSSVLKRAGPKRVLDVVTLPRSALQLLTISVRDANLLISNSKTCAVYVNICQLTPVFTALMLIHAVALVWLT